MSDPRTAIADAVQRALVEMGAPDAEVRLERPRDPSHGDWATSVALMLAKPLKRAPRQIADELVAKLDLAGSGVSSVEIAGPGFLNFRLSADRVGDQLGEIVLADETYGFSVTGAGEKVIVEWVSANPTGPLHLGHGRQAALGDAICDLLTTTGWSVYREYYYNDAGNQIEMLAKSVRVRYLQILGEWVELPENGYQGDYILEIARQLHTQGKDAYKGDESPAALEPFKKYAVRLLRAEQDRDLSEFRVQFHNHYLESSLYADGRVEGTIAALRGTGLVFDQDGAVWLRTTHFGDDKDRVMVKSDGSPTYFLPDVAYHMTKWERGFQRAINVQGSDHHGTVARVRAGLRALGLPEGYPEYVLHQMVRLEKGGEEVKFSKRAGSYTTLRELFEMVGVDVARYFFLMRKPEAQLVFDLDVALDQSEKNPVYKIQYAHARMCSIFGKAGGALEADAKAGKGDPRLLVHPTELALIKQLAEYPEVIERAAAARAPHMLCEYLEATAGVVNSWYHAGNPSRSPELAVLAPDPELRAARLMLARAVRVVLRNGLRVLNVFAPVRMERAAEEQEAPPVA